MIVNCPTCGNLVIKGFDNLQLIPLDFSLKCGNCKGNVKIEIAYQRVVIVNGHKLITNLGENDGPGVRFIGGPK